MPTSPCERFPKNSEKRGLRRASRVQPESRPQNTYRPEPPPDPLPEVPVLAPPPDPLVPPVDEPVPLPIVPEPAPPVPVAPPLVPLVLPIVPVVPLALDCVSVPLVLPRVPWPVHPAVNATAAIDAAAMTVMVFVFNFIGSFPQKPTRRFRFARVLHPFRGWIVQWRQRWCETDHPIFCPGRTHSLVTEKPVAGCVN